jgi:protein-disulfide isomerase
MLSSPIPYRAPRVAALALFLAALGIVSPACADDARVEPKAAASEVVAEVGGKPITLAELEQSMAPQLEQLERQRRKMLEEGLARLVEERLIEAEAAAQGTTAEALVAAEVEKAGGAVTDEEATAFYEQNRARVGNRTLEQLMPQIKSYLAGQKTAQAREAMVASLRAKHATRILLEPDRAPVVAGDGSPAKGPADAPVTIVEFSDFQCPFCSRVLPAIEETVKTYGDQVRVVFRQYPLNIHPQAQKAAEASLCANDQGKFWELHDAMFADQRNLGVDQLKAKAAGLGLDAAKFDTCLDSGRYAEKVAEDMNHGISVGVNGTPAIFVNGRFLSGAVPFSEIAKLVDDELARKGIEPKKSAG